MIRLPEAVHTVCPTLHPAFAMRGMPQMFGPIYTAIRRAREWSRAAEGPKRDWKFILTPTVDEVREYLNTRSRWGVMAVDIETPRDHPTQIDLVGVGIEPYTACVFPWTPEYAEVLRPALADPEVEKVGHNFAYDQYAFMANDCDVAWPIWDTIDAEAILRPPFKEAKKRRWLALSTVTTGYYNMFPYWKEWEDPVIRAFYRTAFPHVPEWLHPRLYCGVDVIATRLVEAAQRQALTARGMLQTYTQYTAPANPRLVRMSYRGIPVDEERRAQLQRVIGDVITEAKGQIEAFAAERHAMRMRRIEDAIKALQEVEAHELATHPLFTANESDAGSALVPCDKHSDYRGLTKREKCPGCATIYRGASSLRAKVADIRSRVRLAKTRMKSLGPAFKAGSNDHWRWLLFADEAQGGLGLTPVAQTTVKKVPKVDDESIEALQRMHPDLTVLKERVRLQHALHDMGDLSIPVDANGRAHVVFSQHRTETQRIASGLDDDEDDKRRESQGGNIQNKKDLIRSIFCAGDPEYVFVEWDWKQIELWVMAWLAEDMDLLMALLSGADVHSLNAAAILGCEPTRESAENTLVLFEGQMRPARHAAKRYTHGKDYGMGPRKAGSMYQPCAKWTVEQVVEFLRDAWVTRREGVSPQTVRRLANAGPAERARLYEYANTVKAAEWGRMYEQRWPGLAAFQRAVIARAERDECLTNPFGYMLKYWNFRMENGKWTLQDREEALAMLPQSTVNFMMKATIPPMDDCFSRANGEMLLVNHDAFGGRVLRAALPRFYAESRRVMEREWPQLGKLQITLGDGSKEEFPFVSRADFMVGWNWGKYHVHKPSCHRPPKCDKIENPTGLQEWRPNEPKQAGAVVQKV